MSSSAVSAGFPSPAEDFTDQPLDLNSHLAPHPVTTFMVRVAGESMSGLGIMDGDLLVVDRGLTPQSGSVVVVLEAAEFLVKTLEKRQGQYWLVAAHAAYPPRRLSEDAEIWGVVRHSIRNFI